MKALRGSAFFNPLGLALLAASVLLAVVVRATPLSGRVIPLVAVGVLAYLATVVVLRRTRARPRVAPASPVVAPHFTVDLTPREIEVLRLIASGFTAREIAALLVIEESTVRRHTQNIYDKIDAQNIADATRWYIAHFGFPQPPHEKERAATGHELREKGRR